jgi:hypothetical protein
MSYIVDDNGVILDVAPIEVDFDEAFDNIEEAIEEFIQ